MAAERVHCAGCGKIFDRRQVTQSYCFAEDCRAERNRENVRAYRRARAELEHGAIAKLRRGQVAA